MGKPCCVCPAPWGCLPNTPRQLLPRDAVSLDVKDRHGDDREPCVRVGADVAQDRHQGPSAGAGLAGQRCACVCICVCVWSLAVWLDGGRGGGDGRWRGWWAWGDACPGSSGTPSCNNMRACSGGHCHGWISVCCCLGTAHGTGAVALPRHVPGRRQGPRVGQRGRRVAGGQPVSSFVKHAGGPHNVLTD